jgi:AcrR family transcriptional regulator
MSSPNIQSEQPGKRNTKNRILIAALELFNEAGAANTTTNQIADEIEISPGNLHYHFRTKAELMSAILAAFETDTKVLLLPPGDDPLSIDDLWLFLHLLLERLSVYRFLFRDFETIVAAYPELNSRLRRFAVSLTGNIALHLLNLEQSGVLATSPGDRLILGRSIAVQTLFSARFDALTGVTSRDDNSAIRAAQSALHLLLPYLGGADAELVQRMVEDYR